MTPAVRLRTALAALAVDPTGLGGLWLFGRAGPLRQIVTDALAALPLPLPLVRLATTTGDEALFGGLDVTATLSAGRPVLRGGLLDRPAVFVLPMAERCSPGLAARLSQAMDRRQHALVALDESADEGEGLPAALADRLGLFLDLSDLRAEDLGPLAPDAAAVASARDLLPKVRLAHDTVRDVVLACTRLGIRSQRAPMQALVLARILAALDGREVVEERDLAPAAALCLAHRAPPLAEPDQTPPAPPPEAPPPEGDEANRPQQGDSLPSEILVDAARAALPDSILAQLALGRAGRMARGSSGSGAAVIGNRKGRPLPARRGKPRGDARLDLIATLRAAAPWQGLRRAKAPPDSTRALFVTPSDLHIKRSKEVSDRLLIFAVDASGSAAVARLAEAKGAVELLLAGAYARRDHVALLTFRGTGATMLLPPTRSLVQTKQKLRGLPGGGATPLGHGLQLALQAAVQARSRGMTPTLALLTDGRGNIALDGRADRAQAETEATRLAQAIRAASVSSVVIDTATRPNPRLLDLAGLMAARYVALPRATAQPLAHVLGAALEL